MKHIILYVPGLGDQNKLVVGFQRWALRFWRPFGVRTKVIRMRWTEPVPLRPRFEVLLENIDTLHKAGNTVSLVGTSAGASAVLSAFALKPKKIAGVVTICGKIQGSIPQTVKELNPGFAESLQTLTHAVKKLSNEDKKRIMNIYSPLDAVVPADEAVLPSAQQVAVKAFGHNPTCVYVLLLKGRFIASFLRRAARLQKA